MCLTTAPQKTINSITNSFEEGVLKQIVVYVGFSHVDLDDHLLAAVGDTQTLARQQLPQPIGATQLKSHSFNTPKPKPYTLSRKPEIGAWANVEVKKPKSTLDPK